MKKTNLLYIIISAVLLFSVFVFTSCSDEAQVSSSSNNINMGLDVYYMDLSTQELVSEYCEIDGVDVYDMAVSALNKMKETPMGENRVSAIPENVEILSVAVNEKQVTVNLSNDYYTLKAGEEMYCRSAIVWTLTGLYFVDGVSIWIDGTPLKNSSGNEMGVMTRDNLFIDAQIDPEPTNSSRTVVLYFASEDGTELVKEERRIEVNTIESLEKYVMEALIAGPEEEGHIATVPSETKIRNIETADGICYVDLSQEFVTKHSGGTTGELLTIYSIVNSLTELSNVEKVQFLIEGEKQDEFKGHVEFGKPFEPMIIGEDE